MTRGRRRVAAAALLPLVGCLIACGPTGDNRPLTVPDEPATSGPPFTSPAGTLPPASATVSTPRGDTVVGTADRTADLRAEVGDVVRSAVEELPGLLDVETTIAVGTAGAHGIEQAVAVCEAARSLGYERVRVAEADGSTLVAAGPGIRGDACAEY